MIGFRKGLASCGVHFLAATVAAGALWAAPAAHAGAADAVLGGAVGQVVHVSLFGAPPTTSAPLPAVRLASSGGRAADAAGSVSVGDPDASAPFGGELLDAAELWVSTQGEGGSSEGTTSTSAATQVDAMGGMLTSAVLASTCTSSPAGWTASTTLADGRLVRSPKVHVALPVRPEPNTTYTGTGPGSGQSFTVILNEQVVSAGSLTVNAAHVILGGPAAVGDIVIGQSWCATSDAAPLTGQTPADEATRAPATAPASQPAPASAPATPPSIVDTRPRVAVPSAVATAALPAAVAAVAGGAFGFSANVGLFGGPSAAKGPMPVVSLPAGGANDPVTATAPTGSATYGPARIFESGELKVSTQGTTGPTGSSSSSASVAGVGPGPVTAKALSSTCTSTETAQSASASFTDGRVTTSEGPNKDESTADDTVVPIPANPAPNTAFGGTIETVGDRFRLVVNEQQVTADAITVNAVHLYLLGPIAVGELIIGQSRCGRTATRSAGGPSTASGAGAGSGATGGTAAGGGSAGSAARRPLAATGTRPPLPLGLTLVTVGLAATLGARRLRRARSAQADGQR